jgi:hypothetical protein
MEMESVWVLILSIFNTLDRQPEWLRKLEGESPMEGLWGNTVELLQDSMLVLDVMTYIC